MLTHICKENLCWRDANVMIGSVVVFPFSHYRLGFDEVKQYSLTDDCDRAGTFDSVDYIWKLEKIYTIGKKHKIQNCSITN